MQQSSLLPVLPLLPLLHTPPELGHQSIVTIRVDDVNESMPNLASATTLDGMSEVARRHDTVAKGAAVQLSA